MSDTLQSSKRRPVTGRSTREAHAMRRNERGDEGAPAGPSWAPDTEHDSTGSQRSGRSSGSGEGGGRGGGSSTPHTAPYTGMGAWRVSGAAQPPTMDSDPFGNSTGADEPLTEEQFNTYTAGYDEDTKAALRRDYIEIGILRQNGPRTSAQRRDQPRPRTGSGLSKMILSGEQLTEEPEQMFEETGSQSHRRV